MPSNQEKLDAIYNALFQPVMPENIYRSAEEEKQGVNLIDSIQSILSMVYEGVVERLALDVQEQASVDKVVRVARGEGPELRPWAIERAKLIWQKGRGVVASARVAMPTPISMPVPTPAKLELPPPEYYPTEELPKTGVVERIPQDTPEAMVSQVERAVTVYKALGDALQVDDDKGEHSK